MLQSAAPVLLHTTKYYFLLQSITPVLVCTTSTIPILFVLQSTSLVLLKLLLRTTKYYSSISLYYTTPVLLRTTKNYSSTTTYYKVPLQYYSNYYSTTSTTPYYEVLLHYFSLLQGTTPVSLRTTNVLLQYYSVLLQFYSVLQSTTLYYSVLQSTNLVLLFTEVFYSSTGLYFKVLLHSYSVLCTTSTTPVLLCTTPALRYSEKFPNPTE